MNRRRRWGEDRFSDGFEEFGLGCSNLGERCVFVLGGTVAQRAGHDGGESLGGKVEDFIELGRNESFHGAGIDTEEGGAGE